MSETVYLIAGGAGLLLIGLGLGFWAAHLRSGRQVAKAADVQKQFDDYRQNVAEHFGRTAEHFQTIGQQYRELYEHMASGADTLFDQQAIDEKLSLIRTATIESPADNDEPPESEANEPKEVQVEDAESAAQGEEDADEPARTYH